MNLIIDEYGDKLFRQRITSLKKAKLRARDPEFQDIWELKINQLIRNEKVSKLLTKYI